MGFAYILSQHVSHEISAVNHSILMILGAFWRGKASRHNASKIIKNLSLVFAGDDFENHNNFEKHQNPMRIYENQWKPMEIIENQWKSKKSNENHTKSLIFYSNSFFQNHLPQKLAKYF